jgi:molecular chaperone DnaK (HSP70)
MGSIISIDFGTSNTVVSEWLEGSGTPQAVLLEGIGRLQDDSPTIPSLLYIDNLAAKSFRIGNAVISSGLDQSIRANTRLFRQMKRSILNPELPQEIYTEKKLVMGPQKAAQAFLDNVCQNILAGGRSISELVLTVPVMSFEHYLNWLATAVDGLNLPANAIPRIIDEPTAAAFGYGIDHPEGIVLVIDFGGGTLDLSLVKLPKYREVAGKGIVINPGQMANSVVAAERSKINARVIGKTYRQIGGADIDKTLIDYILDKSGYSRNDVLDDLPLIYRTVEELKIALSNSSQADFHYFLIRTLKKPISLSISIDEFEGNILNAQTSPVLSILRSALAEILAQGESEGIGDNKIDYVLLVGGTTLIPAIRDLVFDRFGKERVLQRKPFEAVSKGALVLATSNPLEDFLQHSYALEVMDNKGSQNDEWELTYLEIIPSGTVFPTRSIKLKVPLQPIGDNVETIEFIIAEIEKGTEAGERIVYDHTGKKLVEKGRKSIDRSQIIRLLRDKCSVPLYPRGMKDQTDRLELTYSVDENHRLLLTVKDTLTGRFLMIEEPVTQLE